ncbi:hypothetical protein LTR28_008181 [Elasticomyces elasticus]|nr:hypothetical protein LTR28_008181 [Elasticomyces elasticus]
MILSMLVTLRDQGIPLPAGAILLSPWVDLTHSFPSVAGDGENDYIPPHGFLHKPSVAWPPPNADEMKIIAKNAVQDLVNAEQKAMHRHSHNKNVWSESQKVHERKEEQEEQEAIQGFTIDEHPDTGHAASKGDLAETATDSRPENPVPGIGRELSIKLDGKMVEIKDQIQLYTTNKLLSHPLVSPVLQPSLGGLPPMLIQVGGAELLRDEQIYLAHKAAHPSAYPPGDISLDEYDPRREVLNKYPPTDVQLQVWDDLCHVPHTLSFTRPAKFMYRSVAQFGAWALARAQKTTIDILADDDISVISSDSSSGADGKTPTTPSSPPPHTDSTPGDGKPTAAASAPPNQMKARTATTPAGAVGKAGDHLPPFTRHMIRQRIDRHGLIHPLAPPSEIPSLHLDPASIGSVKAGPVRKWLAAKAKWDARFAAERRALLKQRVREMAGGYDGFEGLDEVPPPTALAGRRRKGMEGERRRKGKSWGLAMWSGWGSKHDETVLDRAEKMERAPGSRKVSFVAAESSGGGGGVGGGTKAQERRAGGRGDERRSEQVDAGLDRQTSLERARGTSPSPSMLRASSPNPTPPHTRTTTPSYPFKLRSVPHAPPPQHNNNTTTSPSAPNSDISTASPPLPPQSPHREVKAGNALAGGAGAGAGQAGVGGNRSGDGIVGNGSGDGVVGDRRGDGDGDGNGERIVDGMAIVRPPLETFFTAREGLEGIKGG